MKPAPHKSILNRAFQYVPSANTDLRATFARVRREQAGLPPLAPVIPIQLKERKWAEENT